MDNRVYKRIFVLTIIFYILFSFIFASFNPSDFDIRAKIVGVFLYFIGIMTIISQEMNK